VTVATSDSTPALLRRPTEADPFPIPGYKSRKTRRKTDALFYVSQWIHESAFDTGVWQAPTCDDRVEQCANWAAAGECAKNPGFMLGGEVAGQCVKSCCANGEDVKMPEQLTAWQLEFCASCAGSRYEREFKEMRQSGSIGRGG
jgi:hypothetical protein